MMNYDITITVPADRLELFVNLVLSEGLEIKVTKTAGAVTEAKSEAVRTVSPRHVGSRTLPEIIWSVLQSDGTTVDAIQNYLIALGYKRGSSSSALSVLTRCGQAEKREGKYFRLGAAFDREKARAKERH